MSRDPTDTDMLAFVRTHGDETWFLAPILEESRCLHREHTFVPYGDGLVSLEDSQPCERCVTFDSMVRAWYLYEEGDIGFDSTETYLEMTP